MGPFEWDEAKNAANRAKHGLSFEEAVTIWESATLTGPDDTSDMEFREKTFGLIAATTVVCVVHTERNGRTRIISARKATKSEREAFYARIQGSR
jgi:uncharacterized DUF497 family protein